MNDCVTLSEIKYYDYDSFVVVATAADNRFLCVIDAAKRLLKAAYITPAQQNEINLLLLKPCKKGNETKVISNILNKISVVFGIDKEELKIRSRKRDLVYPRQICMYLISKLTAYQPRTIAQIFDLDRTTVLYSIKQIEQQIEVDKNTRNLIIQLQ